MKWFYIFGVVFFDYFRIKVNFLEESFFDILRLSNGFIKIIKYVRKKVVMSKN